MLVCRLPPDSRIGWGSMAAPAVVWSKSNRGDCRLKEFAFWLSCICVVGKKRVNIVTGSLTQRSVKGDYALALSKGLSPAILDGPLENLAGRFIPVVARLVGGTGEVVDTLNSREALGTSWSNSMLHNLHEFPLV